MCNSIQTCESPISTSSHKNTPGEDMCSFGDSVTTNIKTDGNKAPKASNDFTDCFGTLPKEEETDYGIPVETNWENEDPFEWEYKTKCNIQKVELYNNEISHAICEKYGKKALVCSRGILFGEGAFRKIEVSNTFLIDALKTLADKFPQFAKKDDAISNDLWNHYYFEISEKLPIFRLVSDSSDQLVKAFQEGGLFYKWGTSIVQTVTGSLDDAETLSKALSKLIGAAHSDAKNARRKLSLQECGSFKYLFYTIFKQEL